MKNNSGNWLASGLVALGIIMLTVFVTGSCASSANRCINSGCSNTRAPGSSYCYIHKSYTGSITRFGGSTYKTAGTGTGAGKSSETEKTYTSTYSRGSTSSRSSGNTGTRTYNTLNNDPADYDDPEDYADDAWGDDFDDWDEAYDYWEDY